MPAIESWILVGALVAGMVLAVLVSVYFIWTDEGPQ